jgi:hypothetical protein
MWLDEDGHYNLVLNVFESNGSYYVSTLCITNGLNYPNEPIESWQDGRNDGLPYYRTLVQ